MLSPDTPETNSVTVDGVTVSKWRAAERFSSRTVVYYLTSSREAPVSVRIVDDIPEGLAAEDLMFHPTHGGESWSSTDSEIVFEEELAPEGELTTICRVQGHDPEPMEALLDAEMNIAVDPPLEVTAETDTVGTEETIETTEAPTETTDAEAPTEATDAEVAPEAANAEAPTEAPNAEAAGRATLSPPSTEADSTADTGIGSQRKSAPAPVETALGAVEDDGESFSGAGSAPEPDPPTAAAEASGTHVSGPATSREPPTDPDPTPTSPMTPEVETPSEPTPVEDTEPLAGDSEGVSDAGGEGTMGPGPEQSADAGDAAEAKMAPATEAEPEPIETATESESTRAAETATASEAESGGSLVDLARELEEGDLSDQEREVLQGIFGSEVRESHSLEARIRHLQTEVADLKAYSDAMEAFLDQEGSGSQLMDRLEGEFEALSEDFDSLSANVESLSATIQQVEAEVADHDDTISALDAEQAAMDDRVEGLSGDVSAVRQELASVDTQMQRLEQRLDEGDIFQRFAELERQVQEINDWKAQMRELFT